MLPLTAEITPSVDEKNVQLGPNLAGNQELCAAVVKHIAEDYWYPYELAQMHFWDVWKKIDAAYRARVATDSLEITGVTKNNMALLEKSAVDAMSAKAQTPAIFKQVKSITDIIVQTSWTDGIPVRAEVPDDVFEHPLYQPNEQSAQAANAILRDTAAAVNLHNEYRKSAGNFVKYGYGWALTDFCRELEDAKITYPISANPMEQQAQLQGMQQGGAQIEQLTMGPNGPVAIVRIKRIKKMFTSFKHLNVEDVFIDPLIPCDPIERQPCPFVREHVTPFEVETNVYDPVNNPLGYINTELVADGEASHFLLNAADEQPLFDKLKHRYNLTDTMLGASRNVQSARQKWTAFPLLRINEQTGELDTGDGTKCPDCNGEKVKQGATCPTCKGSGKARPPLKRYVVTIYGQIRQRNVCLRIQAWPEGMDLPIQYAADMAEDTTCAYPMSKTEIALIANNQLCTAENQFLRSKEQSINRGWKVKEDSPANAISDFNRPNVKINYENNPEEAMRVENNNFDETVTLAPFIARKEDQIKEIIGATDQVLGELAQGRRSALELGNAIEAGKNPIVVMGDSFNRQMMGGWARRAIQNLDLFGDRDWIREKTGREFFGRFRFFTAVGEEFVKKMGAQQNVRYLLESSANDPSVQEVRPQLWNKLFNLMGIKDVKVPDGGMKKAIQDGMTIVSRILGDGLMLPAEMNDPDEIYIGIFEEALKDPYWQRSASQNLPLLQQRLMQQQQILAQKQLQAQLEQQQMMLMQAQIQPQPKTPGRAASDHGQQMQNIQG